MTRWGFAGMVGLMLAGASVAEQAPTLSAVTISEKLHVIYDPHSREVTRRMVRVFDPHPEMALEFSWDPAPGNWPGVTPDGFATGAGVLSWRVPGAASYDPRAVHHTYEGAVLNGRFEGEGRLTYRDGSFYRGNWVAGVLQGPGEYLDAAGNRYEGPLVDGKPEGQGILRSAEGWVYTGGFSNGLRDGHGAIIEPGGLRYTVEMVAGVMQSSTKPVVYADSLLGGLLPAQSGGDAGKTQIAVTADTRLGQQQEVGYAHYAQNGEVLIVPLRDRWRDVWNGTGGIGTFFDYASLGDAEWADNRAHTQFRLATQDGSRVRLKSLDLAVDYSLPHLRPVLVTEDHYGCTGFRPSFNFLNYGWGQVENATARVGFRNGDAVDWAARHTTPPSTPWYQVDVGSFDQGMDVYIRNALIDAGVDVTALENRRFTCPSAEVLETCKAQIQKDLNLGALTGLISGWGDLQTDMIGELSYDWVDAFGERHHEVQSFSATISLAAIEVPGGLAECGDGGAFALQAPQYLDVDLPYDAQAYRINIPVRGNPNVSSLLSGLRFYAERSSIHQMQMEATFADGSVRKSAPVKLFFLHNRTPEFQSGTTPAICTLPPERAASC
jgi:hypothetical protein